MELRDGFKKTELGLIPEDWSVYTVRDLIELLTDYDANGSFSSVAENVKSYDYEEYAWYVRSTDLENNSNMNKVKYVDKSSYNFLKKTALYGGELLFLKRGDIGNVYLFEMKTEKATVAPNLYLLKLNKITDSKYLYYYFTSNIGQLQLKSKNASSTLGALYKDDVKSIFVPLPPTLKEQTLIANALSDADSLIKGLEKVIAKKSNIKQGTMQKLLKPKESWVIKKLGNVATFHKGKGLPKSHLKENGKYKCIHYGELFTKYKESINTILSYTDENENCFYSVSNDVLMPTSDVTPNGLATASCIKEDGVILGGDVLIIRVKPIILDGLFLSFYVTQNREQVMKLVSGSTVYHLYGSDMCDFDIVYPNIEEQIRIASILSDMDAEIATLETKLDKYKKVQLGMMQNLLTGKMRIV